MECNSIVLIILLWSCTNRHEHSSYETILGAPNSWKFQLKAWVPVDPLERLVCGVKCQKRGIPDHPWGCPLSPKWLPRMAGHRTWQETHLYRRNLDSQSLFLHSTTLEGSHSLFQGLDFLQHFGIDCTIACLSEWLWEAWDGPTLLICNFYLQVIQE